MRVQYENGSSRKRVDWIDMAQDRIRWQALGNAVMNLRVPYDAGNS